MTMDAVMHEPKTDFTQTPIEIGFAAEELAEWTDVSWVSLDKEFNDLFIG